jgi:hypothetical protein
MAATATEELRLLPMPAWAFGAIALASFMVLLGVLWSFRNTAAKYDTPIRVSHDDPRDPQAAGRAADPGAHH